MIRYNICDAILRHLEDGGDTRKGMADALGVSLTTMSQYLMALSAEGRIVATGIMTKDARGLPHPERVWRLAQRETA